MCWLRVGQASRNSFGKLPIHSATEESGCFTCHWESCEDQKIAIFFDQKWSRSGEQQEPCEAKCCLETELPLDLPAACLLYQQQGQLSPPGYLLPSFCGNEVRIWAASGHLLVPPKLSKLSATYHREKSEGQQLESQGLANQSQAWAR